MGACDFETRGFGKTAQDAFNEAVDRARYEHGHGGYTGTIAEKSEFVELRKKPFEVWREFKTKIAECKAKEIAARKERAKPIPDGQWRVCDDPEHFSYRVRRLEAAYKRFREAPKGEPIQRALALAAALATLDYGDDKWGPAMCLRVKRGEYLFFGYASS